MARFKDAAGREWELDVNLLSIKQVRQDAEVDLLAVTDGKLHEAIADPIKLVAALYSLCEEQAKKLAITPEQFGRSLRGDAIEAATFALLDAIAEFFPERQRVILKAMNDKARAIQGFSAGELLKAIEGINPADFLKSSASAAAVALIKEAQTSARAQTDPIVPDAAAALLEPNRIS